ncbi:hypothetical protein [Sphingomonas kyungheensis]|uniref:Uncharacterized protein n=1 Tax=Sphingomonas kyungheensis TaxID=1069987 RepID=A0ABU8H402_9SPHN
MKTIDPGAAVRDAIRRNRHTPDAQCTVHTTPPLTRDAAAAEGALVRDLIRANRNN